MDRRNLRYTKLQSVQYNDNSIVENLNIPYRSFIENEKGYELEVSCKLLNSRGRIGGPLHLKLNIINIGGINIENFKIDINAYSSEDNRTPYYDRFVLWIKETLEVGQSIEKDITLQNSYREFDLSYNDLSSLITNSEKDLRSLDYKIPRYNDLLDLTSKTNLQSKTKILDAISSTTGTPYDIIKAEDFDDDSSKEDDSDRLRSSDEFLAVPIETKDNDISFSDVDSLMESKKISNRTKRNMSTDKQYHQIISPIYDNFYCGDDTLVINKKKKMKSIFLTDDFDYLISTLPSIIHIEFKHSDMRPIPCRQYQFKLCSEYFTGDLLVARPGMVIPKDKTPRYSHYNILMLGTCKNGKTSLVNSILTLFNNRVTLMSPYLHKLYHENKSYLLYNIKDLLPESLHVRFYDCPLDSISAFSNSQYSYNNLDLVLNGNFPYGFLINSTNVDLIGKVTDDKLHKRLSYNNLNSSVYSLTKLYGNEMSELKSRPLSTNSPLLSYRTKLKDSTSNLSNKNSLSKIHVVILSISYTIVDSLEEFKLYVKLFKYITQLNIPVVIALTNTDQLSQEKIEEYVTTINNSFRSYHVYPISNYTLSNNKLKSFERDRNVLRLLSNSIYLAHNFIFKEFNEENIKKANYIKNKSCFDLDSQVNYECQSMMFESIVKKTNDTTLCATDDSSKYRLDGLVPFMGEESLNVIDMTKYSKDQINSLHEDIKYDGTIFENITHYDISGEEEIDVILAFDAACIVDQEMLDYVKYIGLSITSQYPSNINIGGFLFGEKMQNISNVTYNKLLFENRIVALDQKENRHSADGDTLYRTLNHCKTLLDAQYKLSNRQQLWIFISECSNDNYYQNQIKKLAETLRGNKYNAEIYCFYLRNSIDDDPFEKFLQSFADLVVIFNDISSMYNYLTPPTTSYNNMLNPKLYLKNLLRNKLTGYIPYNIGDLTSITSINLNVNLLSSFIPSTIGNLINLTELQLSFNKLIGPIPNAIGNLRKLKVLKLNNNCLNGPLPDSIGKLTSLRVLKLGNNKLRGTIPYSIEGLTNLVELHLNDNYFSGGLPESIISIKSLTTLFLQNNENLSGEIYEQNNTTLSLRKINVYGTKIKNNLYI
ncbi:L domain-like protein [Piromyces finnis]|uniref:L domain-like protein n=1 Tax=Piromyces finnis TaxID=1754191 RepID=A0A1Y1VKT1_9FUNG|nr:L domain-like protein [Piromyces finnis]|eukprot:ORX59079.1 L domain-like protein [Piromyces finnis]